MRRSWPGLPTHSIPNNCRSITGRIASAKLVRAAEVDSTPERGLMTLLEFVYLLLGFEACGLARAEPEVSGRTGLPRERSSARCPKRRLTWQSPRMAIDPSATRFLRRDAGVVCRFMQFQLSARLLPVERGFGLD